MNCSWCDTEGAATAQCEVCRAPFCSRACFEADWVVGDHTARCRAAPAAPIGVAVDRANAAAWLAPEPSEAEWDELVERLHDRGTAAVPFLSEAGVRAMQAAFVHEMERFPEYRRQEGDRSRRAADGEPFVYVGGAFGAFGNPASFHNPMVRKLRLLLHARATELFRRYETYLYRDMGGLPIRHRRLEQLFDRMRIFRAGTSLSAESWHRDESMSDRLEPSDEIFGGWVNLDAGNSQSFSHIPGSHRPRPANVDPANLTPQQRALYAPTGHRGFNNIDLRTHPELKAVLNGLKEPLVIPPGHWGVFPQKIVHEVLGRKARTDQYRVFAGFRLTHSDRPLFDHAATIDEQGVPFIPSGQTPPMYAKLWAVNWRDRLQVLSEGFNPVCRADAVLTYTRKPDSRVKRVYVDTATNTRREMADGQTIAFKPVHRFMKSLADYGLPRYEAYTDEEKRILTPQPMRPAAPGGTVSHFRPQ